MNPRSGLSFSGISSGKSCFPGIKPSGKSSSTPIGMVTRRRRLPASREWRLRPSGNISPNSAERPSNGCWKNWRARMITKPCDSTRIERYFRIERHFLGDDKLMERRENREHLDGCAKCRELLNTLQIEKETFLMESPFREFAARHLPQPKSRLLEAASPRRLRLYAGLAACLVLLPLIGRIDFSRWTSSEDVRVKGGPIL